MKLMAVMIAVLFLISTTWAQGQSTENGRESEPMPTMNDITIHPASESHLQILPQRVLDLATFPKQLGVTTAGTFRVWSRSILPSRQTRPRRRCYQG